MPGQLRGRAPLPCDAGFGPEPMRTLPRGKARPVDIRASGAWLVGTRGLEARTACAAVARLGRAQGPAGRLRRQRGRPGSVRLTRGRRHGTGARPRTGGRGRGRGRGRGGCGCGCGCGCAGASSVAPGVPEPGTGPGSGVGAGSGARGADRWPGWLPRDSDSGTPGRGRFPGGEPTATGWRAGTIRRGARRRARNCRWRPAPRQPPEDRARKAGCRHPAGAGPGRSGPQGRTRRASGFPDHPSGTGRYAAALLPAPPASPPGKH